MSLFQPGRDGKKLQTSEPGLLKTRMSARPHAGKSAPDLDGSFYKFTLDKTCPANNISDPTAANKPWPYVVMHMPKLQQTRVVVPEPTTAVDATAYTPADAPSAGHLGGGSEITPDESLEEVSRLVERLSLAASCAHCGTQDVALQRCSICKHVWYCGAQCQKKSWTAHKKTCASLEDAYQQFRAANAAGDWHGVLKWKGRMEEMMQDFSDAERDVILRAFYLAHRKSELPNWRTEVLSLQARRIEILGKLQRLRDQGEVMCSMGNNLSSTGKDEAAAKMYERARAVGEAHGFFSLESLACKGLGQLASKDGRHEEAEALLRNSLAAAPLSEGREVYKSLAAICALMEALFKTRSIEDLEELDGLV